MKINQEEINDILKKHELWLQKKEGGIRGNLIEYDLRYADFSNKELSYFDFRYSDLSYANFSMSNIVLSDLSKTNLYKTNFVKANLMWANISGSNLISSDLSEAILVGANILGSNFHRANLNGVDIRGAKIDIASFPLSSGSLDIKIDKAIAIQLLYHFCRLECDDEEIIAVRNSLLSVANKFHRVEDCGILMEIKHPIV